MQHELIESIWKAFWAKLPVWSGFLTIRWWHVNGLRDKLSCKSVFQTYATFSALHSCLRQKGKRNTTSSGVITRVDDTWTGCVTDCRVSPFSGLTRHSQHCTLAYGKKINKMQPVHVSSPINYPAYPIENLYMKRTLVWLHGGEFKSGSSLKHGPLNEHWSPDPRQLASTGNVIVIR